MVNIQSVFDFNIYDEVQLDDLKVVALISIQGDRVVYRTSLKFSEVSSYVKVMESKEEFIEAKNDSNPEHDLNNRITLDDVRDIENRFGKPSHAEGITNYILDNKTDFILPSLTMLSKETFVIKPIYPTQEELNRICGEEVTEIQLQDSLPMILQKLSRPLVAELVIPKSKFDDKTVTIGDGNHRVRSLKDTLERLKQNMLSENNLIVGELEKAKEEIFEEFCNMTIGVDFYVEPNQKLRKKIFVALNSSLSIEKSLKSFLTQDDKISRFAQELIGYESKRFLVKHFNERDKKKFIGFEKFDNIGANSIESMSFNILKNMIGIMHTGGTNAAKFEKLFVSEEIERKILKDTQQYFENIFDNMEPFTKIQGNLKIIPAYRKEYISLTGAGLYLIAYFANECKKRYTLAEIAEMLNKLNWKREISPGKLNPLFLGGILSSSGTISNTRTAIKANVTIMKDEFRRQGYVID